MDMDMDMEWLVLENCAFRSSPPSLIHLPRSSTRGIVPWLGIKDACMLAAVCQNLRWVSHDSTTEALYITWIAQKGWLGDLRSWQAARQREADHDPEMGHGSGNVQSLRRFVRERRVLLSSIERKLQQARNDTVRWCGEERGRLWLEEHALGVAGFTLLSLSMTMLLTLAWALGLGVPPTALFIPAALAFPVCAWFARRGRASRLLQAAPALGFAQVVLCIAKIHGYWETSWWIAAAPLWILLSCALTECWNFPLLQLMPSWRHFGAHYATDCQEGLVPLTAASSVGHACLVAVVLLAAASAGLAALHEDGLIPFWAVWAPEGFAAAGFLVVSSAASVFGFRQMPDMDRIKLGPIIFAQVLCACALLFFLHHAMALHLPLAAVLGPLWLMSLASCCVGACLLTCDLFGVAPA